MANVWVAKRQRTSETLTDTCSSRQSRTANLIYEKQEATTVNASCGSLEPKLFAGGWQGTRQPSAGPAGVLRDLESLATSRHDMLNTRLPAEWQRPEPRDRPE
jgi:hypothetical protein